MKNRNRETLKWPYNETKPRSHQRNDWPINRDTLTFCSYGEGVSECYLVWLHDEERTITNAIEPLHANWTDNHCAGCGRLLIHDNTQFELLLEKE
jgi:Pyruvate/2-oxoacid:ferredoxin oxidoreductase delta subunit